MWKRGFDLIKVKPRLQEWCPPIHQIEDLNDLLKLPTINTVLVLNADLLGTTVGSLNAIQNDNYLILLLTNRDKIPCYLQLYHGPKIISLQYNNLATDTQTLAGIILGLVGNIKFIFVGYEQDSISLPKSVSVDFVPVTLYNLNTDNLPLNFGSYLHSTTVTQVSPWLLGVYQLQTDLKLPDLYLDLLDDINNGEDLSDLDPEEIKPLLLLYGYYYAVVR